MNCKPLKNATMKKAILILIVVVGTFAVNLNGQNIELTFAGDNNGQPVLLDSVITKNLTQGGEVTLYPPDLTLILIITEIEDRINRMSNAFGLNQNYPNPCSDKTSIQFQIPEKAKVEILVSNLLGQNLLNYNKTLNAGGHTFTFYPGKEICPEGWHIPTDEEFKVLEGMADSNFPIGHQIWNNTDLRGEDTGKNLKSTSGWYDNGNGSDIYGYCLLPTGYWFGGGFENIAVGSVAYSSTINNNVQPWYRGFVAMTDQVLYAIERLINNNLN